MAECGKVFLVGAGPGDPDLLTVAAKRLIETADAIVYDRLISPHILDCARADCEKIFVGKEPEHSSHTQADINSVLVDCAGRHHCIVRLKGGDPYVFGRGGEEATHLAKNGIEFEVIPGVTSAIAAPAAADIPLTYRGYASQFTVVTGHEDPEKAESDINWDVLAHTPGTLVFLMGMKNIGLIVSRLVTAGLAESTPAAVVEHGTLPNQREVAGTLGTIEALVNAEGITNPAVIVIGSVVSCRELLRPNGAPSKQHAPLAGKTVCVTRAREQASSLKEGLEALGAHVVEIPLIRFEGLEASPEVVAALDAIDSYDWIVFDSVNGVKYFLSALEMPDASSGNPADGETEAVAPRLGDPFGNLPAKIAAVGPATKKALEEAGVGEVLMPERFTTDDLLAELLGILNEGDRVLIVSSDKARTAMRDGLVAKNIVADLVPFYRNIAALEDREKLTAALREGSIDAITFTCSSAVVNFADLIGDARDLLEGVALYSIGPVTTATLAERGFTCAGEADNARIPDLVTCVKQGLQTRRDEVSA